MKTETTQITKLLISDLMGEPFKLDPVTVILEDFEPGRGRIIIECYGTSWASSWSAMSGRTVAQFVSDCGADYVIDSLTSVSRLRFSPVEAVKLARRAVCDRRRRRGLYWEHGDALERDEARALYDQASELRHMENINDGAHHERLLTKLFGPEWWHALDGEAVEPNPSYLYLQRVVQAVQAGLLQAGLAKGKVAA